MQNLPAVGERKSKKKTSVWEVDGEELLASSQGKMGLGRNGANVGCVRK